MYVYRFGHPHYISDHHPETSMYWFTPKRACEQGASANGGTCGDQLEHICKLKYTL